MRAQEAAAKVPVKLTVPMILCIFPALMVVVLGPAIISIGHTVLPVMNQVTK
jgi:tight adherence protein C